MITHDRGAVSPPASLGFDTIQVHRREAAGFFSRSPASRAQEVFKFPTTVFQRDVLLALAQLFHDKCAYCERRPKRLEVDRFRPPCFATGVDGAVAQDHYWWLATEWPNLYPACPDCNRTRGNRFPVRGERCALGTPHGAIEEDPLLLDPCGPVPPEELVFGDDGRVASETERGRCTIEMFALNRSGLVSERRRAASAFRSVYGSAIRRKGNLLFGVVRRELSPDAPFLAMKRQLLARLLATASPEARARVGPLLGGVAVPEAPERQQVARAALNADFREWEQSAEAYSVDTKDGAGRYFRRARLIERVEIVNYKNIRRLVLEAAAGEQGEVPWMVLLGENGTGKSAVLQAIALALSGSTNRGPLEVRPDAVLRRRCSAGFVRVHLAGGAEPIELRFERGKPFRASDERPKVLLLGYGATRLLPSDGIAPRFGTAEAQVRVANLFDPLEPLVAGEAWLLSRGGAEFDMAAAALRQILDLNPEDRFVAVRDVPRPHVLVHQGGMRVALQDWSVGYRSVVALVVDIMAVMSSLWPSMEVAEGIVLLDELELHLHPRWQMRIVGALRRVFPRVQFIVTTHSPLCLRGTRDGEVIVLRRTPAGVESLADLPPVAGLRADQLLTSRHFGLESTLDPETGAMLEEYNALLAVRDPSWEQVARIKDLEGQVGHIVAPGSTPSERLVLESARAFLQDQPDLLDPSRRALKQRTVDNLKRIWAEAEAVT